MLELDQFRAEIHHVQPNRYAVGYYGPDGRGFGVKDHTANTWRAFESEVLATLDAQEDSPSSQNRTPHCLCRPQP